MRNSTNFGNGKSLMMFGQHPHNKSMADDGQQQKWLMTSADSDGVMGMNGQPRNSLFNDYPQSSISVHQTITLDRQNVSMPIVKQQTESNPVSNQRYPHSFQNTKNYQHYRFKTDNSLQNNKKKGSSGPSNRGSLDFAQPVIAFNSSQVKLHRQVSGNRPGSQLGKQQQQTIKIKDKSMSKLRDEATLS